MFTSIWTYIVGNRVMLLVIALAAVSIFALGYTAGVKTIARINAHELATARSEAAKAQKERDDADWALAKADMEARHQTELTRSERVRVIRETVKVRVPGKCSISADAMKALNDPAIIGEGK